jgi:RNA polymerase-binding transcription factor DksA
MAASMPKIKAPKIQPPKLSRASRDGSVRAAKKNGKPEPNRELIAERDRLLEKFTVMQADLGGAFYEMAIRDHVKMDVLTRKAAELQRLDMELGEVEEALELERSDATGVCANCGAEHVPGARFCSSCGEELKDD